MWLVLYSIFLLKVTATSPASSGVLGSWLTVFRTSSSMIGTEISLSWSLLHLDLGVSRIIWKIISFAMRHPSIIVSFWSSGMGSSQRLFLTAIGGKLFFLMWDKQVLQMYSLLPLMWVTTRSSGSIFAFLLRMLFSIFSSTICKGVLNSILWQQVQTKLGPCLVSSRKALIWVFSNLRLLFAFTSLSLLSFLFSGVIVDLSAAILVRAVAR